MKNVVLDFETYWSQDYTLSKLPLAVYVRSHEFMAHGAAVKIEGGPSFWVDGPQLPAFLRALDWSQVILIGHNLAFDGLILSHHYGIVPAMYLDTLGMSRAVFGTQLRRHALTAVGEHLGLGGKLDGGNVLMRTRGRRMLTPAEYAEMGAYACRDADLTWGVAQVLLNRFPAQEIPLLDLSIRCVTQPCVYLDVPLLEAAHRNEVAEKGAALAKLNLERVDVNSNDRLAALLRAQNVEPPTKISKRTEKETYAFSKSDEEFVDLQLHHNPVVRALVETRLRVKSSIFETRTLAFTEVGRTGLAPVELNYAGAMVTQRFSGAGTLNYQNLPRHRKGKRSVLRDAIVAPEGFKLVTCDLSQIELRIAACLAGETIILDALRRKDCVYSQFASRLFGVEVSKALAKADDKIAEYRQIGKVSVLQCQYMSGAGALKKALWVQTEGKLVMSPDEAKKTVRTFRRTYQKFPEFWDLLDNQLKTWFTTAPQYVAARAEASPGYADAYIRGVSNNSFDRLQKPFLTVDNGTITGPHGLALKYPDIQYDADRQRFTYASHAKLAVDGRVDIYSGKLFENLCQWLARIVMTDAMIELRRFYKIVMTVHDELVLLVPDALVEQAKGHVSQVMSRSPSWWPELPVECEVGVGQRYGDAK